MVHRHRGQRSQTTLRVGARSYAMDFTLVQTGERRGNAYQDGYDTQAGNTSPSKHHSHGQYGLKPTLSGHSISRIAEKVGEVPALDLPEAAADSFPYHGTCEHSERECGALRVIISNEVGNTGVEDENHAIPSIEIKGLNGGLKFVFKTAERTVFEFNIDLPTTVSRLSPHIPSESKFESHQTTAHGKPWGNSSPNANNPLNMDDLGQNADLCWEDFEAIPDFPHFGHDTASSSNNFDYLANINPHANPPLFNQESPFFPNDLATSQATSDTSFSSTSSQSSRSSTFSTTTTPSTSATTTPNINLPPDMHLCLICHSNFKRPSDLRRHEAVHFPEKWKYHCKQVGCERNGRKAFYRRDKLRTHERKVHGLED